MLPGGALQGELTISLSTNQSRAQRLQKAFSLKSLLVLPHSQLSLASFFLFNEFLKHFISFRTYLFNAAEEWNHSSEQAPAVGMLLKWTWPRRAEP